MISYAKLGKAVLWILGVPVVSSIVLLIVVYLINIPDEALRPDVTAVLADRHDAVPDRDNLFFPILALDVRDSQDLNADGQRLYANYLAALREKTSLSLTLAHDPAFPRKDFVGDQNRLCSLKAADDCIDRVARDPTSMSDLLSDNALLLERYQGLLSYQRFENRLHPTRQSPFIDWSRFVIAKRLYLTSIALDCARGRLAEAVSRLQADTIFSRRVLAEPEALLLDKLILTASFRGDLLLAAGILHHGPLTETQYGALHQIAAPITLAERSLRGPYAREYEMVATVLKLMGDPAKAAQQFVPEGGSDQERVIEGRLAQHFFKPNATLNMMWALSLHNAQSSEVACQDRPAVEATRKTGTLPLLSYAYNPIGRMIVRISSIATSSYTGRLCELEALQRNLALQIGPG